MSTWRRGGVSGVGRSSTAVQPILGTGTHSFWPAPRPERLPDCAVESAGIPDRWQQEDAPARVPGRRPRPIVTVVDSAGLVNSGHRIGLANVCAAGCHPDRRMAAVSTPVRGSCKGARGWDADGRTSVSSLGQAQGSRREANPRYRTCDSALAPWSKGVPGQRAAAKCVG